MDRRGFLKKGAVLVAAGLGVPTFLAETARVLEDGGARLPLGGLSRGPASVLGGTNTARDPSRRVLVVVQLAGGNDGLNTLVPYADPAYYQARPSLAVPRDQVLPLDGQVGLNPLLRQLQAR